MCVCVVTPEGHRGTTFTAAIAEVVCHGQDSLTEPNLQSRFEFGFLSPRLVTASRQESAVYSFIKLIVIGKKIDSCIFQGH